MTNYDELFAEWTKQTFAVVKKTQDEVVVCRKEHYKCRDEVHNLIADLDKKIAVMGIKIAIITSISIVLMEEVIRRYIIR